MQVSIVDTVPGAGSGKEAAKPSQAASDAFAILLQNALTQNPNSSTLRISSENELAGQLKAEKETFSKESESFSEIEPVSPAVEDDPEGHSDAGASETDVAAPTDSSSGNQRVDASTAGSDVAALTIATEAQISQSRARTGTAGTNQSATSVPQQGSDTSAKPSNTGDLTSEAAKASQSTSHSKSDPATNGNNSGQATAQVIEASKNTYSRPSNTLAAAATVSAQTGVTAKTSEVSVTPNPTQTNGNLAANNATDNSEKPGSSAAGVVGKELLREPATAARGQEPAGNLLLNNSPNGKTSGQYSVQPGRMEQPGPGTQQAAALGNSGGTVTAQQAVTATPQSIAQTPIPSDNLRQAAGSPRSSTMPVTDSSSVTATTGQTGTQTTTAAARTTAPPPARPAPPPANLNEQISVQIKKAVNQGVDKIRIQLKPAELGRLDVQLEVTQDGRVAAIVNADRPETLDMLRRDARGLQQALQDAGLQMDSGNLSFNLGNGGAPSGEQSADGGRTVSSDEQATVVSDASESPDNGEPRRQSSDSMIDVEV